jgi:glutamine amidotransferase
MIAIIDYGIGNLLSVKNMFKKAGVNDVVITNDPDVVAKADKIILPGVGHFDYGMKKLKASACYGILQKKAIEDKVPVLGICLGAQLLTNGSEEGTEKGLGWIDAETVKFDPQSNLPVPHMGWSEIRFADHPLFKDMYENPRFYFVHSFFLKPKNDSNLLCETNYGSSFAAGIASGNIYGVQFHPEKSHKFGLKLLENFAKL